jgi:alpha-galactosidase
VRYVQGLYRVWGTLQEQHPHVIWQSCSGGGGRANLAILRLADQIWVSDNTEPTARLAIQEGFSQIFPANTMEAWVTDMGADYLPCRPGCLWIRTIFKAQSAASGVCEIT